MSNPIIDEFDKASLIKDINERDSIICNYQKYGLLDRDDAIKKIQELRISDKDIQSLYLLNHLIKARMFSRQKMISKKRGSIVLSLCYPETFIT